MIFIVYIYQYKKYSLNFTYMYAVWKKPNWNNAYKIFKSFKNCLLPNTLRILPNPIKWLLDKISVVSTPVPYFNLYHPIKLLHPYWGEPQEVSKSWPCLHTAQWSMKKTGTAAWCWERSTLFDECDFWLSGYK